MRFFSSADKILKRITINKKMIRLSANIWKNLQRQLESSVISATWRNFSIHRRFIIEMGRFK